MFNNEQIKELMTSSEKDCYYHEEVASFCVFDYYCNNIQKDLMPIYYEYFKNYEIGFRKHYVVDKNEFDPDVFKEFLFPYPEQYRRNNYFV